MNETTKDNKKPTPYLIYDYHECIHFLEKKHGFKERDYYSSHQKSEEISKQALEATRIKFNSISFWTLSPLKYNEEERKQSAYYNKYKKELLKANPLPPEVDFYGDYLLENHDIHNGGTFTLDECWGPDQEEDPKEFNDIFDWLMEEFGTGEEGSRTIDFRISW